MKKIVLATALFFGMTAAALANNGYICNDSSDTTNVRSGPSAVDYSVVDQLGNGYNVNVLETTRNASGYVWARVKYNSNRYGRFSVESGWISGDNVCWKN